MPDPEKTICGFISCKNGVCFSCPYNDGVEETKECKQNMENDVLSVLKQQEPIPPKWKKLRGYASPFCTQCGSSLPEAIKPNYCQHCGKAVKWDE